MLLHDLALLAAFAGGIAAAQASQKPPPLTAGNIIDRVKARVGVPWREQTVDTIKAGSASTPVTGIATTFMATLDVLKRAAASGNNLIITHEPTFYCHLDRTDELEAERDPVLSAKMDFIRKHNLVVWRFHDHWHMRRPDGIQTGMNRALGWERYQNPADPLHYTIPPTTVGRLASEIKAKLKIRALRVVGDPGLKVTRVAMAPGAPGFGLHRRLLQREDVEALVMGEGLEWETIPYAVDAIESGRRKALIILGHVPSEQAGMEECARWLKTFITEVPIRFIPAAEPFRLAR